MHDTTQAELEAATIERLYHRLLSLDFEPQIEPVLAEVLRLLCEVMRANLVYVERFADGNAPSTWRGYTVDALQPGELRSQISYGIVRYAIAHRRSIECSATATDEPVVDLGILRKQAGDRVICAPLGKVLPIGVIYVRASHAFETLDHERIEAAAGQITRIAHRLVELEHGTGRGLAEQVRALQDARISEAMERHDGNISQVARALGVGRAFVHRVVERLSPTNCVSGGSTNDDDLYPEDADNE